MKKTLCICLCTWGVSVSSLWSESLLLKGAVVHTVSQGTLEKADVLVRDGKIAAVGALAGESADKVLDLTGLHLYPGLVSASTDMGLVEVPGVRASVDDRETGDFTPEVESWVAVNPESDLLPVARANGITYFCPTPQGRRFTGTSSVMSIVGWTTEDMLLKRAAAMHLFWPEHSLSVPVPGSTSGKSLEDQARERKQRVVELDRFLEDASAWIKAGSSAPKSPAWESMRPVLAGDIPLMVHAQDVRQINAVLAWARKHSTLRVVIVGGRDAWKVAGDLAKQKVAVIYSEIFALPEHGSDSYDVQFSAPGVLHEAGAEVAICEGLEKASASGQRNLPYSAAQAAAFGLAPEAALAAITLVPARLFGVGDRAGSIEQGKLASMFASTGDILDIRSEVKHLWIAGKEQSLESKHTRLAEKYRSRPKAQR